VAVVNLSKIQAAVAAVASAEMAATEAEVLAYLEEMGVPPSIPTSPRNLPMEAAEVPAARAWILAPECLAVTAAGQLKSPQWDCSRYLDPSLRTGRTGGMAMRVVVAPSALGAAGAEARFWCAETQ
jgi:hypothetical protein